MRQQKSSVWSSLTRLLLYAKKASIFLMICAILIKTSTAVVTEIEIANPVEDRSESLAGNISFIGEITNAAHQLCTQQFNGSKPSLPEDVHNARYIYDTRRYCSEAELVYEIHPHDTYGSLSSTMRSSRAARYKRLTCENCDKSRDLSTHGDDTLGITLSQKGVRVNPTESSDVVNACHLYATTDSPEAGYWYGILDGGFLIWRIKQQKFPTKMPSPKSL